MKSPCQTAITNLIIYFEKRSDPTTSEEELEAIYDAVYDKNFEMTFNGKRYNYNHLLQYTLAWNQFQGLPVCNNFEAEIFDNITFRYTHDFHQEGMPQKSCKMHNMTIVNPNNGRIISRKVMTGQSMKEFRQFNKKYIETVEKNIEACKTSSASTRFQTTNNISVGNVPSSASPAGLINKNYNRRSKNSRRLVSRIMKRCNTMSTRIFHNSIKGKIS